MLIVDLADMHSGSTRSLFPDRVWQGENGRSHIPSPEQRKIYSHFMSCAESLKQRTDKMIIVVKGDAIDGNHPDSDEHITRDLPEQAEIHKELMREFMQEANFKETDKLIYVRGTKVHTENQEARIASDLNAEIADHVQIEIDGYLLWFIHKGPRAGKGQNKSNSLRNDLRDTYYDCIDEGRPIPDMVSYGHFHKPVRATFDGPRKEIRGYIAPSWQMKTRYAYGCAPTELNKIGMTTFYTGPEGLSRPIFHILEMESAKSVNLW